MASPVQDIEQLKSLLRYCTAHVSIDGRARGTAFFISDTQLLTCEHVVKDREEVEVQPFDRKKRTARVVQREPETELDLALLEVEPDPKEPVQPCVLLDGRLHEADYYVAGYPKEEAQEAGLEAFRFPGHPRETTDGRPQLLQLEAGKQVTWGLSGAPLLNTAVGAVTAIVRSSRNPQRPYGGAGIPVSRAAEAFADVKLYVSEPPLAVKRWHDALGKAQWQELGQVWDMHACVDLHVQGARDAWYITTDPHGEPRQYITPGDLGYEVMEAMFRWAQRRRVSGPEEVELLGRLLARALFPADVESRLRILDNADEILVRLHIAPTNDLADVPWELAAVPTPIRRRRFLAAERKFRFVRVADQAAPAGPMPAGEPGPIQVLGLVGLPPAWKFPTVYGEQSYQSPNRDDIQGRLSGNITGTGFRLKLIEYPELSDVEDLLRTGKFQAVHYVGVGRIARDRRAQLTTVEAEGNVTWQYVDDLLNPAAESGVRLVVLEFTVPPADQVVEPVTPSALGEMLKGSINAVVFTTFPVHPLQFQGFNKEFYEHLGQGDTVEAAVQHGRRRLEQNKVVEEAAGFGWFTLITGPRSDIRLVPQREKSPQAPRPKVAPSDRDEGISPTPGARDEFSF